MMNMSTLLKKIRKVFTGFFETQPHKVVRVKFLGWENQEMRQKFRGSVGWYEQELQTGRVQPRTPPYLFYLKGTVNETSAGTPSGSELEMWFNPDKLSDERIREYLHEIGLRVDDSSWRVLKESRKQK